MEPGTHACESAIQMSRVSRVHITPCSLFRNSREYRKPSTVPAGRPYTPRRVGPYGGATATRVPPFIQNPGSSDTLPLCPHAAEGPFARMSPAGEARAARTGRGADDLDDMRP